jgi:hypothetical protein
MICPASRFAAAVTYWLLGGATVGLVLVYLWLSQKVKTPETNRANNKAEASRRVITLHLFY